MSTSSLRMRPIREADMPDLTSMYQEAFSGHPWFESLDERTVRERINRHMQLPGFSGIIATADGVAAASCWWNTPTIEDIRFERGDELAAFAHDSPRTWIIWERELIVRPSVQGRGYSNLIRHAFVETMPEGSLIFTRMRDDNERTLRSARALGFLPTGISMPSGVPGIRHGFYFLQKRGSE